MPATESIAGDNGAKENGAKENVELSERELEILRLVATGASNKEIAHQLFISANTVKVHLRNIFAKISAGSRTEAALYAVRTGLVQPVQGEEKAESPGNKPVLAELETAPAATAFPAQNESPIPRARRISWGVLFGLVGLVLLGWLGVNMLRGWPVMQARAIPATQTATPRWRELAAMPTARQSFAAVVYENDIFAIGGEGPHGVTGVVERYDPRENAWTVLSPKPLPVSEVGAAVVGGLVYVPGGRTSAGSGASSGAGSVSNVLEVYDPQADRWESRSGMPEALSAYSIIAYEGRLYVFGGWDGKQFVNTVYGYDPTRNEWKTYSPMPTARGFSGAALSGGKIYVIGGFDGDKALQANEIYFPNRDDASAQQVWEAAAPLPESCTIMGAVSLVDSLYLAGGDECGDGKPVFFMYSPVSDSWQSLESMASGSFSHAGVVSSGPHVYVLGGMMKNGLSAKNLAYQAIYTISIPMVR